MMSKRSLSFCLLGLLLLVQSQAAPSEDELSCMFCGFTSKSGTEMQTHINAHLDDMEAPVVEPPVRTEPAEKKASDIDDKSTLSSSIIPRLFNALAESTPGVNRILIDTDIDHYGTGSYDFGWGAGYRNIQMILSSLFQNIKYYTSICETWNSYNLYRESMASILEIQIMLESAWIQGFDEEGAAFFKYKLVNTKEWLGATELVTLLASLGIDSQLIDFHRPTSDDGRLHPEMFSWILQYFVDSRERLPLLLQRQGQSEVIIGIEQDDSGVTLLVLDPAQSQEQIAALGSSEDSLRLVRRKMDQLFADQYQIVQIKGIFRNAKEKQDAKYIKSLRIPDE